MYIPQITGDYVKFIRGTPTAWDNLKTVDANTLYFISEAGASKGKLYLGTKLISDGTVNIVSKLSDLTGVSIASTISDNSLLVYDAGTSTWINKPVASVLSTLVDVMKGATADEAGKEGLVPAPTAGQQSLYLKGDGTWANPTSELESSINAKFNNLYGGSENQSQSIQQIAEAVVAKVVDGADSSFDTLKEIAEWINDHDAVIDVVAASNDIADLKATVYGTEEQKDEDGKVTTPATAGLVAVTSDLQTAVSNLQTLTAGLSTDTTNLKGEVSLLKNNYTTLNTKVTSIEEKLLWSDLVDEDTITSTT